MRALILTAPEPLRGELRDLTTRQRIARCARSRSTAGHDPLLATRAPPPRPTLATRQHRARRDHRRPRPAPHHRRATTLDRPGVSTNIAAKLLIAAGDNPNRLANEAGFAALCGASPVQASSANHPTATQPRRRHQANNARWTVAMVDSATTPTPAPRPTDAPNRNTPAETLSAASRATSPASSPNHPQRLQHPNALT